MRVIVAVLLLLSCLSSVSSEDFDIVPDLDVMSDANIKYSTNGLITRETIYNEDGSERFTDYFRYMRDKRLRSIERVYPDGTREKTSLLSKQGRIHSLSVVSQKKTSTTAKIFDYDDTSRISKEHVYTDDIKKSFRSYLYAEGAKKPFGSFTTNESFSESHIYDENGKLIKKERKDKNNRIIDETIFIYTESGLIEFLKIAEYAWQGPNAKTFELQFTPDITINAYQYEYDADDNLIREVKSINGKIDHVAEYAKNSLTVDSYYKDGLVFLKVYYIDNKKVKEELYTKDKMIGLRIFE